MLSAKVTERRLARRKMSEYLIAKGWDEIDEDYWVTPRIFDMRPDYRQQANGMFNLDYESFGKTLDYAYEMQLEYDRKQATKQFENELTELITGVKKMSKKYKTVGSVRYSKKDRKKFFVMLTEPVSASKENPVFLQCYEPTKRDGQTEEDFAALKEKIKFNIVQVSDA